MRQKDSRFVVIPCRHFFNFFTPTSFLCGLWAHCNSHPFSHRLLGQEYRRYDHGSSPYLFSGVMTCWVQAHKHVLCVLSRCFLEFCSFCSFALAVSSTVGREGCPSLLCEGTVASDRHALNQIYICIYIYIHKYIHTCIHLSYVFTFK